MNFYNVLKIIFSGVAWLGLICFWVNVVRMVFCEVKKKKKRAKRCAILALMGGAMCMIGFFGSIATAVKQYRFNFDNLDTFTVSSNDLSDGVWNNDISNQADGQNLSPELHWDPVPHADRYCIIMIDETADNWMHWFLTDYTHNSIEKGKGGYMYVGPYPPSGTHTYTVYVFALKNESFSVSGAVFDAAGNDIKKIAESLNNSPYSDYNNLISYGKISGTYTSTEEGSKKDGNESGGNATADDPEEAELSDLTQERDKELDTVKGMLLYEGIYGSKGEKKVTEYMTALLKADPDRADRWAKIMKRWDVLRNETEVNKDVLPDGLTDTDELCIVCLGFMLNQDGSMRPELIQRLTVAKNSAEKYPNAYIVCTGGGTAPGKPGVTEAGQMADWLEAQGIDRSRIIVEDRSTTTSQNAIYTLDILMKDYPQVKEIAITTGNYHVTTGMLVFDAEAMLRGSDIHVVSNAGCYIRDNDLSDEFQAGALIELAGDYQTAIALYNGWFDYSQVTPPEEE